MKQIMLQVWYGHLLFLLSFLYASGSAAQSTIFHNYNVEDGLVQSQAQTFCQDKTGAVWIGTIVGLSRFDGTNFTNYTKANGLSDNCIFDLFCDKDNTIWCATYSGLSRLNEKGFFNYNFSKNSSENGVSKIIQYTDGSIWCLVNSRSVYRIIGDKAEKVFEAVDDVQLYSLTIDGSGNVWVGGSKLYLFKDGKLAEISCQGENHAPLKINNFYTEGKRLWLCTYQGLFYLDENKTIHSIDAFDRLYKGFVFDIKKDADNVYWIATANGVFEMNKNHIQHLNKNDGLTSNLVRAVLVDKENNIWMAQNGGEGLFLFQREIFTSLTEKDGLASNVVAGFVKENNKIIIATNPGDLNYFQNGKILKVKRFAFLNSINVCCVYKGNIWFGTLGKGVFRYNDGKMDQILPHVSPSSGVFGLLADSEGRLWIATNTGPIEYANNQLHTIDCCKSCCFGFTEIGKDSILVGTTAGLYLLKNGLNIFASKNKILHEVESYCFVKLGDKVWIGTDNNGILIWNLKTDEIENITTQNGMLSNTVYNLLQYNGSVYAGTGKGIHKISKQGATYKIKIFDKSDGLMGAESNLNANFINTDSTIWFGTTKGIFILDPSKEERTYVPPNLELQNVLLFSKPITDKNYYDTIESRNNIPSHLSLPHNQNSLTFSFKAITFVKPEKITYQYYVDGLEQDWSSASSSTSITYPSLPPGRYVFKVKALRDGEQTGRILEYPFEIQAPFSASGWFKALVAVFLILIGLAIQFVRHRQKQKEISAIQKMRSEEQRQIQQKIAEDFHDEMGNKLTRISLLTDILKAKTENKDLEIGNIVTQIKENATELYKGTTDIIWSLNVQSNSLLEIMRRISHFGEELFEESKISFSVKNLSGELEYYKIRPDVGRNMIMILKEALNNVLKHSGAKNTTVAVEISGTELTIHIKDDGYGFNVNSAKTGHGIENMKRRASRIGAKFYATSDKAIGSEITLVITIKNELNTNSHYRG